MLMLVDVRGESERCFDAVRGRLTPQWRTQLLRFSEREKKHSAQNLAIGEAASGRSLPLESLLGF